MAKAPTKAIRLSESLSDAATVRHASYSMSSAIEISNAIYNELTHSLKHGGTLVETDWERDLGQIFAD
jgi:hypothetical protein